MQKKLLKMTETLTYWYSSNIDKQELSNKYQNDRVLDNFQAFLSSCALDKIAGKAEHALSSAEHPLGQPLSSTDHCC